MTSVSLIKCKTASCIRTTVLYNRNCAWEWHFIPKHVVSLWYHIIPTQRLYWPKHMVTLQWKMTEKKFPETLVKIWVWISTLPWFDNYLQHQAFRFVTITRRRSHRTVDKIYYNSNQWTHSILLKSHSNYDIPAATGFEHYCPIIGGNTIVQNSCFTISTGSTAAKLLFCHTTQFITYISLFFYFRCWTAG